LGVGARSHRSEATGAGVEGVTGLLE